MDLVSVSSEVFGVHTASEGMMHHLSIVCSGAARAGFAVHQCFVHSLHALTLLCFDFVHHLLQ
jgi:hypothetical protein